MIPLVAVVAFIYQFICFIFIKLFGATWFMYSRDLWSTLVAALGFQEGWIFQDNAYVNYPVWYVSVLLVCYIVFFLVTYLSKRLHVSSRYFYLAAIFLGISIAFNAYLWQMPLIIIVLIIANSTTAISFLTRESMWCFTIINFLVGTASYYLLEKNINKLLTIYQRKKQQ